MDVPRERIFIENRSTNTGENGLVTKQLLAERHIDPRESLGEAADDYPGPTTAGATGIMRRAAF